MTNLETDDRFTFEGARQKNMKKLKLLSNPKGLILKGVLRVHMSQ